MSANMLRGPQGPKQLLTLAGGNDSANGTMVDSVPTQVCQAISQPNKLADHTYGPKSNYSWGKLTLLRTLARGTKSVLATCIVENQTKYAQEWCAGVCLVWEAFNGVGNEVNW